MLCGNYRARRDRGFLIALLAFKLLLTSASDSAAAPAPVSSAEAQTGLQQPSSVPTAATATRLAPAPRAVAPQVLALRTLARQLRQLLSGSLEPAVEPRTLFDIALDDPEAMRLEVARLTLLSQQHLPSDAGPPPAPSMDAGAPTRVSNSTSRAALKARLNVDRARLAFYQLSETKRAEVLALCGNYGALEMQVPMDFYIGIDQDVHLALELVREACLTSRYVYMDQDVPVTVRQLLLNDQVALHMKARPYVLDTRYEKAFETDVHLRALDAFRKHGIRPPVLLRREEVVRSLPLRALS